MWYVVCFDVLGVGILNIKVVIVGRRDGVIFVKEGSICFGVGDNNEGVRRWRYFYLF